MPSLAADMDDDPRRILGTAAGRKMFKKALHVHHGAEDDARDDFLTWVQSSLYEAEIALHIGDAAPRRALWSRSEPVSVLGA